MFIQRFIVTGIAYENLKENFINVISGVNLVHQSPWGHYVTILLNMRAKFKISGKNQLDKMRINEYINITSRLEVPVSAQ